MDRFKEGRVDHQRVRLSHLNRRILTIIVWFETRTSRVLLKLQGLASKRTYASSAGIKFYWIKISFGLWLRTHGSLHFEKLVSVFSLMSRLIIILLLEDGDDSAICFPRTKTGSRTSSSEKFFTRHRIFPCCANIFIATRAFAKLNLNY